MVDRNSWFNKAQEEEQGSFCDTRYGTHVINLSKDEAEKAVEDAYYRGDGVVGDAVDTEEHPAEQRYNFTQTDIDGQSYDHPTRLEPGR